MNNPVPERKIIIITTLAHSLVHICELSFPAVAVLVASSLLGDPTAYQKIGFAYFIATFLFGAMSILGGFLTDRLGARRVVLIYLLGSGMSLILVGLSVSYFLLVVSLGLLGFFIGLYHPAGNVLISLGARKTGLAMGIHGMGGNFGLALSPFLASFLAEQLDWRKGFMILGLLPLIFSLYILWDKKIELEFERPSEASSLDPLFSKNNFSRSLLILFIMSILNGMCYRGFITFLPAYFRTELSQGLVPGVSALLQAGGFTSLVLVLGILGQFLGGRLADRFSREVLYTLCFLCSAPFLFLLGWLKNSPLIISALIFALIYFANQPSGNFLVADYSKKHLRGRIFGWFFFMNFGAGSIMSWLAGILGEKLSLNSIFILLALILALAGILGLVLIKNRKSREKPEI